MEVLMGKSSINGPFSMAMLNNQMVNIPYYSIKYQKIMVSISSHSRSRRWKKEEPGPRWDLPATAWLFSEGKKGRNARGFTLW